MKKKYFIIIILFSLITSCKKKPNASLAKTYYDQSLLEIEEKNFPKALQLINKSIEISPNCQALAIKASLFYQNKEFSESLEIYKKILKDKNITTSLKADITNNMACTYLALGDKENARRIWNDLVNNSNYLSPEVAWFNLGLLDLGEAANSKDKELAKILMKNSQKYFNKAVSIANEYADAFFYIAITHLYLKEYQNAKEAIITVLSIAPEHEPAKEILEYTNKKLNETKSC